MFKRCSLSGRRGAAAAVLLAGGLMFTAVPGCGPTTVVIPPETPVPPPVVTPAPEKCEDCHNADRWDPDGAGPSPASPNVMGGEKWGWSVNGHGALGLGCDDCHVLGEHHLDGVLNTLDWPGKRKSTVTANTAHLLPEFLGSGRAGDRQLAFDGYCTDRCHGAIAMFHSDREGEEFDRVMQFGEHSTVVDPKKTRTGLELWGDDPYVSGEEKERFTPGAGNGGDPLRSYWFFWTISDITSAASGKVAYGTCVSCHDPHGTPTADMSRNSNHMVRYNWKAPPKTDTSFFCVSQCHRK